ncbi:MAG: cell division protein FtsZ, partial [Hyphomonadaceae bacterium]
VHQPVAETPKDRSFASLFGWKAKPADEQAPPVARPAPAHDDSFDDDLEIPAFLRRSGNS